MTISNDEIGIVANAIGWTFFGTEGESIVEVDMEDSDKCVAAAKRALEQLERYRESGIQLDGTDEDEQPLNLSNPQAELQCPRCENSVKALGGVQDGVMICEDTKCDWSWMP